MTVIRVAILIVLVAGATAVTGPAVAGEARAVRSTGFEAALVQEANAVRARHGLPALAVSASLRRAAEVHSREMLEGGFFAHEGGGLSFGDRIRHFLPGSSQWSVGENLAMFGPDQLPAREVIRLWMGSPAHRKNLLSRNWSHMGISARFAGSAGGAFGGNPTWVVTLDVGGRP